MAYPTGCWQNTTVITMLEALQYDFMRYAVIAAVLASVICGITGTIVVSKRLVSMAGGVAHSAYGGIGMALFFGFSPQLGALGFALVSSCFMAWITLRATSRADTIISIIWAVGMAVGVIFSDLTPGYGADLMSYLFGSILMVTKGDIVSMGLLCFILSAFVPTFYSQLLAYSYDEEYARTRGIPVTFLHFAVIVLISFSVVLIIRIVGLILVIALLSIPPYIAERFCRSLAGMMITSTLLSLIFSVSGLMVAYKFNLTSGAAIIVIAAICYFATEAASRRRRGQQ